MKTMNKLMICMCIACALAPITALLTGCAQKNSFAQAGASAEMTSPPAVSRAGNTAAVPKTDRSMYPSSALEKTEKPLQEHMTSVEVIDYIVRRGSKIYPADEFVPEKLQGMPLILRSPDRLPDLRLYHVGIVQSKGMRLNKCIFSPMTEHRGFVGIEEPLSFEVDDPFAYRYSEDPAGAARHWRSLGSKPFGGDLVLQSYDIAKEAQKVIDERNAHAVTATFFNYFKDALCVLKTKDGRLVWASAVSVPLSVRKTEKGYAVVTSGSVDYVYFEDGVPSVDMYLKDFNKFYHERMTSFGSVLKVKSGKMLTDNIARMEYENGLVAHWKIRLGFDECQKNIDSGAEPGASIIWHNKTDDEYTRNGIGLFINAQGFSDSKTEPVYK